MLVRPGSRPRLLPSSVGDPQGEVVALEELDVHDGLGVVVQAGLLAACLQDARVEACDGKAGVEDAVDPLGDPGGVGDRRG